MIRFLAAVLVCVVPCLAQAPDDEPSPQALADMAGKLATSLVQVEYTAQYDKGEPPEGDRWGAWQRYSMMQQDPSGSAEYDSWDQLIKEERPAQRGGYLISANRVFTSDPMLHPRFIKSINVRRGSQLVAAKPVAYGRDDSGWILELAEPLKDAKPLSFNPTQAGPYFGLAYERRDGGWATRISGLRTSIILADDGRAFSSNAPTLLVLDKKGAPVTFSGSGIMPSDGSWKIKPESWPSISHEEMGKTLAGFEKATDSCLLRVSLALRSPRSSGMEERYRYRGRGMDDEQVSTEWNGVGILTDESTVLVLANLKPKITARLERVKVFGADGKEVSAQFAGTFKDWGAFVAKLDKPMSGAPKFSQDPLTQCRGKLLLKAEVEIRGETRLAYFWRDRVSGFYTSYKGDIYPQATGSSGRYNPYGRGSGGENFLFSLDGSLIAAPIEHREKVTSEDHYGGGEVIMVPAAILTSILKEGSSAFDPENKPLSEQEENRLAWLGVELQGLDPELARANNVMDQTQGGQSGALVTFVYPNSPASKAGLSVGDILLRLHVKGMPQPLEVQVEGNEFAGMMDQMWTMLDQVPSEYFDQMPKPWGSAESTLTRALTDIGFGTPFTAEVFHDGKVLSKDFKVEEGPPYYDSAKRFKSEAAGLTVRDLTYEVRRFFQLTPEDPGVIVSKVEKGSKAAVAGIKPFEQITSINDAMVKSVADVEAALAAGGELKISVKRMTEGRTVKFKLDPTKPEPKPAGK